MIYDFRKRSNDSLIFDDTPSCTKQNFKDQCDINFILKKYTRAGVNPFVITESARFGDFSDVPDYQDALNLVTSADEAFMQIDAKVRARFQNNPALLIDFLSDTNNRAEAIKLGLIEERVPEVPPTGSSSSGASGASSDA